VPLVVPGLAAGSLARAHAAHAVGALVLVAHRPHREPWSRLPRRPARSVGPSHLRPGRAITGPV